MSCTESHPTCRVNLPRLGQECVNVPGRIGTLQGHTYVTPNNVIYNEPGTTIREFNPRDLRLPQKRAFLGPEVFNGGCATLYSNSNFNPEDPNSATSLSGPSNHMFNSMWTPMPYGQGNHAPCQCACTKCDGPNSAVGWMKTKNGKLKWEERAGKNCQH
jgi:hypothetical protein